MKIIKRGRRTEVTSFGLAFDYEGEKGFGYTFDCDESGQVLPFENDAAEANYKECLSGSINGRAVGKPYVQKYHRRHYDPPVGVCDDCGRHVTLGGFTNTCECGADYNSAGQRLAARSQWGWDTGEHPSDIERIP